MASEVRFNQIFNYWWEDLKWSGVFEINWVYIRDVHHADVKHITYNNTPIANLKDGSEIDFAAGRQLLETFRTYPFVSDIFEAFSFMDEREKVLRVKRDSYYEIFKQLNEKGFIEDTKEKGSDKKQQKVEPRAVRQEKAKPRGKFKGGSDVYYEKKEE